MDRFLQFEREVVDSFEKHSAHPFHYNPLEIWSPRKVAAPERHVQLGLITGHTIPNIRRECSEVNPAFHDIESMLGLNYEMNETTLHPVAEQVWLWGYYTLQQYMRLLTLPGAIQSEFYRKNHDKFIDLLRSACLERPDKRPNFHALMRDWTGATIVPQVVQEEEEEHDSVSLPVQAVSDVSGAPARRLVLAVRSSHVERNKTRKNHHN